VAEAAVIGVPDEIYGESVVAFVVAKPGTQPTEAELIQHVTSQVAKFKAPSRIHFLPSLPKGGIGKILRRELRDKAAAMRGTPVSQA
jgi:acyl-coenzyme A synthetase/AMP-(fatty) acid ligase